MSTKGAQLTVRDYRVIGRGGQENPSVISGEREKRAIQMCLFLHKEYLPTDAEKVAMD